MMKRLSIVAILILAFTMLVTACADELEESIENKGDELEESIENKGDELEKSIENKGDQLEELIEGSSLD